MKQEIVFTEDQVQEGVCQVAEKVNRFYRSQPTPPHKERPLLVLGVLKGGIMFMTDLAKRLEFPLELDFIRVSSYGNALTSSQTISLLKPPECELTGRSVLIVEDLVDSGRTIQFLRDYCAKQDAASIKVAALIDKPSRRQVEAEVDFCALNVPDYYLAGYGMDYQQLYRNLPYIFKVVE